MKITNGRIPRALKTVIYGPEGIGKTTLASRWPDPVFIDTENGTCHMDVKRLPAPRSWRELLDEVRWAADHPEEMGTLVLDTADWAETMCLACVCERKKVKGIEEIPYGKGYVYAADEFLELLNAMDLVISKGIHVVVTAHAAMRKFEQPDEAGAYDRFELKLSKKDAPLLKEWTDMLLFCNYKTFVSTDDSGKTRARGAVRTIYTTHAASWDAKNRIGLPESMPMAFEGALEKAVTGATGREADPPKAAAAPAKPKKPARNEAAVAAAEDDPADPPKVYVKDLTDKGVPEKLAALMSEYSVTDGELRIVVASKGYYPMSAEIRAYDPEFVDEVLVGAWDQVYATVLEGRGSDPF